MDLRKELTLPDVYCIATGAMISSGLFILPGIAHAYAGPAVVFSYFLAGLLVLPGMLSEAELVSAMPRAGGTYFYVTRSMGPAAGTVNGLITWFSMTLKSAFALCGYVCFRRHGHRCRHTGDRDCPDVPFHGAQHDRHKGSRPAPEHTCHRPFDDSCGLCSERRSPCQYR